MSHLLLSDLHVRRRGFFLHSSDAERDAELDNPEGFVVRVRVARTASQSRKFRSSWRPGESQPPIYWAPHHSATNVDTAIESLEREARKCLLKTPTTHFKIQFQISQEVVNVLARLSGRSRTEAVTLLAKLQTELRYEPNNSDPLSGVFEISGRSVRVSFSMLPVVKRRLIGSKHLTFVAQILGVEVFAH